MALKLSTGHRLSQDAKFITDYTNCIVVVFSGTQPDDSDDDEGIGSTATILGVLTDGGGDPTDLSTYGLNWEASGDGMGIASGEEWKDTSADATGTAAWFRCYDTNRTAGASTTAKRFDGRCATSGGQLNLNTLSIVAGGPIVVTSAAYEHPRS